MSIRPFTVPADLPVLIDLIPPSFQYPENPEWSLQADEAESFVQSMEGIQRLWPLIRVLQVFVPQLRDIMRGFVWEEDNQAVAVSNVMRMGATKRWLIGNVSVLPDYRRRGIARKLVEASVEYARSRGAKFILLDVLAGNVPAYTLYQTLGFEHFSGQVGLMHDGSQTVEELPLPNGYTLESVHVLKWHPRYELAQRITPALDRKYSPVEEGAYKQPAVFYVLGPLVQRVFGSRGRAWIVRQAGSGQVVAMLRINVRTRAGGINHLATMVDPAHNTLAAYLVRYGLRQIQAQAPGRRIEFEVHQWAEAVLQAALDAGFVKRHEMHSMGIIVQ
jgi:ribosomal protein S18 acetylase RimI-like enzyme